MVDPNEAPRGYRAVRSEILGCCRGCEIARKLEDTHCFYTCLFNRRKDGQDVIFKEMDKDD